MLTHTRPSAKRQIQHTGPRGARSTCFVIDNRGKVRERRKEKNKEREKKKEKKKVQFN
jgi:hypothetical protein